nr:preprotein translocase subunit SecD [Pedobacter sp. ASV2]
MKQFVIFLMLLILTRIVVAQNINQDMYKKYAGKYGGNSGVCLFDDGKFLLFGYATAVFGSYKIEKDKLLFYPDKFELFNVFANSNKSLSNGVRINFKGFERDGGTFIQFDHEKAQKVFNDGANCFNSPFVYERTKKALGITLFAIMEKLPWYNGKTKNVWHFNFESEYNDFILVYNAPKRENEDFIGMIVTNPKGEILKLSNYGGDTGYLKNAGRDDNAQMQEMMEWKNQYYQSKDVNQNVIFANKHYNIFPEPDSLNYKFDVALNEYVNVPNRDNDSYYQQNQYNDDRYLRKYVKLQPKILENTELLKNNLIPKSIFFSVCGEGLEKSYHYNGFKKNEEEEKPTPVKVKPVKVPPGKSN